MLAMNYNVYIWQLSPQLSKESSRYFCKVENFAYGEMNERSFSNPTPVLRKLPLYWQSTKLSF